MARNRVKGEFSKCCKTTVSRSPILAGYETYCDKCHKKCELVELKARILVDDRKGKVYKVTNMIPHRKIVNVLISDEVEPFEISYLFKECEIITD